jgi:hypothetical protein
MQINPVQNYKFSQPQKSPQFKSAFPVVHWVAETNGSYAPVASVEFSKVLQRKLVGLINKVLPSEQKIELMKENATPKNIDKFMKTSSKSSACKEHLSQWDKSYAKQPIARSFTDKKGGFTRDNKFNPISYLITGKDCEIFTEQLGKPIGKAKSVAPLIYGKRKSAETQIAVEDYKLLGKNFVMDKSKRIYDEEGKEYALHTKFQIIRNKAGKIKDYELVGIKFCPQEGAQNPFVRTGIYKQD